MHVDSHFVIGHAHVAGGKPCQDYAASGLLGDAGAYAIVSDGCSSGGQTDIGARFVTLATAKALKLMSITSDGSIDEIQAMVSAQQRLTFDLAINVLDTAYDDLLATSTYAYVSPTHRFVHLHGDGVLAFRLTDGTTVMVRYDWVNNTPSYPVYDRDDYAGFIAFHGGDLATSTVTGHYVRYSPEGMLESETSWEIELGNSLRGIVYHLPYHVELVAIFTDGVTQIDGMEWKDAVIELLNFKTMTGEFAKRRLNRFVKDRHTTGRGPIDDLSYAVIRLDPEDTP